MERHYTSVEFLHPQIQVQPMPRNIYRGNTLQVSRHADNIPSRKLDQRLFATENVHQSNTGIDRYPLGHDSQGAEGDYGHGDLEKRTNSRSIKVIATLPV